MHPLTTFPELLTFGLFAPTILRITVGLFLFNLAREKYKNPNVWFSILCVVFGGLVFVGLYTQISAILAIALLKFDFWTQKNNPIMYSKDKLLLLSGAILILLSILFTGPGFLAFDLPL